MLEWLEKQRQGFALRTAACMHADRIAVLQAVGCHCSHCPLSSMDQRTHFPDGQIPNEMIAGPFSSPKSSVAAKVRRKMGTPLSCPPGSGETHSTAAHSSPGILGHTVPRVSPYKIMEKQVRVEMSLSSNVQCLAHWGL